MTEEHDVVVVGAGTAGCYAAATAAQAGLDVVILERKTEEEAGHIACGDALKGADKFPEAIPKSRLEPAFTNTGVDHGRFEIPQEDEVLEIPVPGELAVIDRWEYGRQLIAGAEDAGVTFQYDTVVQDVIQNGRVEGVKAVQDGDPREYHATVTIDGAGALSILQDKADLGEATFDTNVSYNQFCSAYREIVHVEEDVPWDDALVFKPTERAAGYLWYFPRTEREINVGLGFQMTEEPMKLVEDLKRDLRARPEFEDATVDDKLGAALPTRRPYDSAVAPGFMAVGDAAGHVNPTTGGGIAGAAYAGTYAADQAIGGYSGGMRRKLGMAQAMLESPELLVLDEPTATLDPEGRASIIDALQGLTDDGTTVFVSSHVLAELEQFIDTVTILQGGSIAASGPIDEVLSDVAAETYVVDASDNRQLGELLDGHSTVEQVRHRDDGRLTVVATDPQAFTVALPELLYEAGLGLRSLQQEGGLEETFLDIVNGAGEDDA